MESKKNSLYLLRELVKRDIKGRYKGSVLGLWWAVLTPLAMLLVFTFVFSGVFKAKWHGEGDTIAFALNLYAGLIVYWFFAEAVSRAPTLVTSQPNFVKKVVFPLEMLCISSVLSALFHFLINLAIVFLAVSIYRGGLEPAGAIGAVLAIFCSSLMLVGIGWFFAAIGVYIRDVAAVVGVALNLLMFVSPIFYPIEAVPQSIRWAMELNPLSLPIEWIRDGLMRGVMPGIGDVLVYLAVSLACFFGGRWVFERVRCGFADAV